MFKKLLVPLDRSTLAEQALGPAAAIARGSKAEEVMALLDRSARWPEEVTARYARYPKMGAENRGLAYTNSGIS
jgi:nucleotide-binding universal stress UspA family protein